MSEFYSALMLALPVSDLISPSSGAFCTSCIRRFDMWQYAYYSTRPAGTKFFLQLRNSCTCRVVRVLPHTKACEYSLYKTLLMMDR